ncbi:hypothetical protein QUF80_16965 [Desulfococcaceae bacterium HSG8]|nr:hypothetical protein [Desulfococcaceae bacterium HSG8]
MVVHELVQYEKLGGFMPFLEKYLMECITIGYDESPMEKEAMRVENHLCGDE